MEICRIGFRILKNGRDSMQTEKYCMLSFTVPAGCGSLSVSVSRTTKAEAQIPAALFDSTGQMRIFRAPEGAAGYYDDRYSIGPDEASSGAIAGPIPPGEWRLVLYKRRFSEDFDACLSVTALPGSSDKAENSHVTFPDAVLSRSPGWYRGELHVHSSESTGRTDVDAVLRAADNAGLDFVAITDHFTSSHWGEIEHHFRSHHVLCLQSMEVSGDKGHANIHGVKEWINPLVDDNEELSAFLGLERRPSMEEIADRVHAMGGIFGINHPLSGMVSWRYADFPIEKADMIDIWASPDGPVSLCYPTLYDSYLAQGYDLTAVGSSDSHDPYKEGPWKFGQLYTYVYADELSEKGIISGVRRGNVYIACGESRMDYTLCCGGVEYCMGEHVPYQGGEIIIHFSISSNPSGNLFVMVSGELQSVHYVEAGEGKSWRHYDITLREEDIRFVDSSFAFIRLEFYEDIVKARFWGMAYKDEKAMRLLSNPVWLDKEN